jgi:hypothetical protein
MIFRVINLVSHLQWAVIHEVTARIASTILPVASLTSGSSLFVWKYVRVGSPEIVARVNYMIVDVRFALA